MAYEDHQDSHRARDPEGRDQASPPAPGDQGPAGQSSAHQRSPFPPPRESHGGAGGAPERGSGDPAAPTPIWYPTPRRPGGSSAAVWVVTILIGIVIGAAAVWYAAGAGTGAQSPAREPAGSNQESQPAPPVPSAQGVDFTAIYQQVAPSVVQVIKRAEAVSPWLGVVREEGSGSGVVIDEQGHVITNYHVVQGADRLVVVLDDNTQIPAQLVATDPSHDLALLRADLPRDKVRPARLGDSDAIRVGEPVMAIGYPFGLPKTATTGIISGLHRNNLEAPNGRVIREVIQTDAAINPGNSGGALVNARGEVIGVNTAIVSNAQQGLGMQAGFIGIGFAVPINIVKREKDQLLAGGVVQHPWLGISGAPVDAETASQRGLAVDQGVQVVEVVPGGPAAKAGLQPARTEGVPLPVGGDVIVAIDGKPVREVPDLLAHLDTKRVGDRVTLQINRDGRTLNVTVTLEAFPTEVR